MLCDLTSPLSVGHYRTAPEMWDGEVMHILQPARRQRSADAPCDACILDTLNQMGIWSDDVRKMILSSADRPNLSQHSDGIQKLIVETANEIKESVVCTCRNGPSTCTSSTNTDQHTNNLQDMDSIKTSLFRTRLKVKNVLHRTSHRLSKFVRKAVRIPLKPQHKKREFIELLSPVDSPFQHFFCPQNLHHEAACSPNDGPSRFFAVQIPEDKESSPLPANPESDYVSKCQIWSPNFNMKGVRVVARALQFAHSVERSKLACDEFSCRSKQDEAHASVSPLITDTKQEEYCMMRSSFLRGSYFTATTNPMHESTCTTKVNQESSIAEKIKFSISSFQVCSASLMKRFSSRKNDTRPIDLWDETSGIDINSLWGEIEEFSGHLCESVSDETSSFQRMNFVFFYHNLFKTLKETAVLINSGFTAARRIGHRSKKREETVPRSARKTKRCSVEEFIPSPARGSARVLQPLSSPLGTHFYIQSGRQQETEIFERGSVPFGRI